MKIYQLAQAKIKKINERVKSKIVSSLAPSSQAKKEPQVDLQIAAPYVLEVVPTRQNTKILGSNWLASFKNNEHSEHGEDGIISKIFEIMQPENKWVCEFGAHDPEIISNTWRLINNEKWNAVLIEADPYYAEKLKKYYTSKPSVHCINTKVSYDGDEKLDNILSKTPIPKNMDFMVIDIDGNDYHVWEAIEDYRAKVVMIEFNASIPTDISFVQPRDMTVNQGNSLKAMVELAARKGYKLIAVTSWNAFFIQDKYYSLFFSEDQKLEDMYVYPAKHPIWMRPFQLYDGTIIVAPWNEMLWHKINLTTNDYQFLPQSMRSFSRELPARDYIIEKSGDKTSADSEISIHLEKIYKMPGNTLSRFAKNVFSRYGEDGIIESLISVICDSKPYFVEIGAGNGITHSRSRNLIVNHHWHGLQFESDPKMLAKLKSNNNKRVKIHDSQYFLAGENSLNQIFNKYEVPKDIDVLMLNTYGMEYFLWESITDYSPKMVLVQFNPTIPNDVKFIQAKDFAVHQGCSLKALCDLAHYKGYELVAATLETAFFLKRRYCYRLFELYGWRYAEWDEVFLPFEMKWFQLYDGTIVTRGLDHLLWHGIRIDEEKLQVVPKGLRQFHQFAEAETKKHFYRV